jgi:hypothetical protein
MGKGTEPMKKYLLAAVAALAIGAPTAKAGTWWTFGSQLNGCVPAATYYPAYADPFMLAAAMSQAGRLDRPIDSKRTAFGTVYAVFRSIMSLYFFNESGCEGYLSWARSNGELP